MAKQRSGQGKSAAQKKVRLPCAPPVREHKSDRDYLRTVEKAKARQMVSQLEGDEE